MRYFYYYYFTPSFIHLTILLYVMSFRIFLILDCVFFYFFVIKFLCIYVVCLIITNMYLCEIVKILLLLLFSNVAIGGGSVGSRLRYLV